MSQFSTQAGVNAYVQKFLAMNEVQSITSGTATSNPLLTLFGVSSTGSSSSGYGSTTSSGIDLSSIYSSSSGLNLTI